MDIMYFYLYLYLFLNLYCVLMWHVNFYIISSSEDLGGVDTLEGVLCHLIFKFYFRLDHLDCKWHVLFYIILLFKYHGRVDTLKGALCIFILNFLTTLNACETRLAHSSSSSCPPSSFSLSTQQGAWFGWYCISMLCHANDCLN